MSKLSLMEFSCALRRREIITSFLWNILSDYSEITVCMPWNSRICCFRNKNPPIFGAKQSKSLRHSELITPPFARGCVKSNRHTPLLVFLRNKGVVSVTFDTTSEPTNAARAELCCHKLCLARRRKTKSTGSRIGEAKWESEASSAWAAYVKRSKGIAPAVWCANRSCWQMREVKWGRRLSYAND